MLGETIEELAERLYRVPKYIPARIGRRYLHRGAVTRIDAPVFAESGESLQLRGSMARDGMIELSLTFRRTQPVRKWHTHDDHHNPDCKLVSGPHKHYPTNEFPSAKYAYSTGDEIPTEDFNSALLAFLEECNIEFLYPYQREF